MIAYSLDVAICWCSLYLVYIILLRRETFFGVNRYYLLSSIIAGLILPLLRHIPDLISSDRIDYAPIEIISAGPIYVSDQLQATHHWDWQMLLMVVYIVGVAFMSIRLAKGLMKIYSLISSSPTVNHGDYTVVQTDTPHLPFSFLRYVFISRSLPLNANLTCILEHELKHVRHRHTLDVVFMEIVNVLFWWNPIIYLYKKELRDIHEYLADASVLDDTDRNVYGQILTGQSMTGLEIALTHQFFHSHIKKRIKMMYQKKSNRPALLKYLLALPLLASLMAVFAFTVKEKVMDTEELNTSEQKEIISNQQGSEYDKERLKSEFAKIYQRADQTDVTVAKSEFHQLLSQYWKANLDKMELIRKDFIEIANQYGMRISFLDNDLFQSFQFVVPRDSLVRYKLGDIPKYRDMVYGDTFDESFEMMRHLNEDLPNKPLLVIDGEESDFSELWKKGFSGANRLMTMHRQQAMKKYGSKAAHGAIEIEGPKTKIQPKTTAKDTSDCCDESGGKYIVIPRSDLESRIEKSEGKIYYLNPKDKGQDQSKIELPAFAYEQMLESDSEFVIFNRLNGQVSFHNIDKNQEKTSRVIREDDKSKVLEHRINDTISFFDTNNYTEEVVVIGWTDVEVVPKTLRSKSKESKSLIKSNSDTSKVFLTVNDVDQNPIFPGCDQKPLNPEESRDCSNDKMLEYIYKNVRYPKEARKNAIEGTTVTSFLINTDGMISDIETLRAVGGGCSEEAQRVISGINESAGAWTPAMLEGQAVAVRYVVPIKFKLKSDEPAKSDEDGLTLDYDEHLIILDGEVITSKPTDLSVDDIKSIDVIKSKDKLAKYKNQLNGKKSILIIKTKKK